MLAQIVHLLPSMLAAAWRRPLLSSDYAVTVFAVSTGLIGIACCYWAAWMHARLANFRLAARHERARSDAAIRLRDGLLAGGQEAITVLGSDGDDPFFVGAGSDLLQAGLGGPDAARLASGLDRLLKHGIAFEFSARTGDGGAIAFRGQTVGPHAVVFMRRLESEFPTIDYRAALDAIPTPAWIRDRDLTLRWGNRAFLAAIGAGAMQDTAPLSSAIERSECDLAAVARDGTDIVDARRYVSIAGQRRALSLNLTRLPDACVAGIAFDVTEETQAKAQLLLNADAHANVLDSLPVAIAIFDKDQCLVSHNRAYARMWSFAEDWLATHPSKSDILDRLRATHSLPEQRDFAAWKRSYLQLFENSAGSIEEFRHLADGRSIRVMAQPHLPGGMFFLFEDVTEQLRMEESFKMLGRWSGRRSTRSRTA
jgi:PAS domain-containing protein